MNDDIETMRAAVVASYGPPNVVTLCDLKRPAPGPRDVLIRVVASTVSSGDARLRARRVPAGMGLLLRLAVGWNGPRNPILGTECAGVVAAVGEQVTRYRVGDEVIAYPGATMGAHATFLRMREDAALAPKPAGLPWNEAASLLFGGMAALHYLRRMGRVRRGERVLILGASGAVGVAAVQVARHAGAEVTAVCSAKNEDLVRRLGATHVIDYHAHDFTRSRETWDIVMDCVGATDYARARPVLAPGGRLLRVVCSLAGQLAAPFQGRLSGHRVIAGVTKENAEDVRAIVELVREGAYRSVIDETLPLSRIAEAHALVDGGHKRGSLVVTMDEAA
jgi:NADPH:quinone reductase-like Zn-dependent oxidoreductase